MRSPLSNNPRITCNASCHGYGATDWGVDDGTPVYALYAGTIDTYWLNGGGNTLDLHGQGLRAHYAHLKSYAVPDGAAVSEGQLIAYSGNTGSLTSGPHLHVGLLNGVGNAIYVNGAAAGPYEYLNSLGYNWSSGAITPFTEKRNKDMLLTRVLSGRVDFRTPLGKAPVRTLAHLTLLSRMLKAEPGGFDTFNDEESAVLDGYIEAANTVGEAQTKEIVAALGKITIDPTPLVDEVKAALAGLSVDEAAIAAAVDAALYNDFGAIPTAQEIAQKVRDEIIKPDQP